MLPISVLLIEGDPAYAASVRSLLDEREFRLTVVTGLEDGVAILKQEPINIAILDTNLPGASGLGGFFRLHEVAPAVPVVILSDDEDERAATAAVQAGAQDYFRKHDTGEKSLRRALRNAIERHDLTERLSASVDELERQRASVLHINALKNDMIAVLAHDIRGPLTSVIGFAELLEEGYLDGEAAAEAARTIKSNAQRLAALASDVLALSRVEHGELDIEDEHVDLRPLLSAVIDLHAGERSIALVSSCSTAIVRGDEERLAQVFDNVLGNAIKYSSSEAPIEVRLWQEAGNVAVAVIDRGIGIVPEEMPRLFERFSRGSNAKRAKIPGTGIGLFIVKSLVERHGGRIEVESVLTQGSTFTVTLPGIEAAMARPPMRITILTPDEGLRRFAAYELRARSYRVHECGAVGDLRAGDMRDGDIIVVDTRYTQPQDVLAAGPERARLRLIGIGASIESGYDALLPRPFLVTDLLQAIA